MSSKTKKWLILYLCILIGVLAAAVGLICFVDPFFHYHTPNKAFYYELNNQRSQNDGITRNFSYDSLITGTSMTENFKTSEAEEIFGGSFIKVPFAGATYKELHDNIRVGIRHNKDLKRVICGLDMRNFFYDEDDMRDELGEYPDYLYDEDPFNDVYYIFNRDIVFGRIWEILKGFFEGKEGGITSFDDYSNWMDKYEGQFGAPYVLGSYPEGFPPPEKEIHLSDAEREMITQSITNNIVNTVKSAPDTEFYYFFPPYSGPWWGEIWSKGELDRQLEAERLIIELLLDCDNVKLFSYNTFTDITFNLDNYKDPNHYGEWINTLLLRYMHDGVGQITKENYLDYLEGERNMYGNFDYNGYFGYTNVG